MVFIKAKETLKVAEADDIRGGTILPVPLPQASSAKTKRSSKTNRRQK